MFKQGVDQISRPEPLNSVSLFSFHDSVELFLQLSSEYLNIGSDRTNFMDYWDLISEKIPNDQELPQKESMRRLNKARVALKHHGNFPSKLDLESFLVTTQTFYDESTLLIFDIPFSEVSLANYVKPDEARINVLDAEQLINVNKCEESINCLAIAFHQILNDYEDKQSDRFGRSPFDFGESFSFSSPSDLGLRRDDSTFSRELPKFIKKVTHSLDEIQKAIKIIALGIDYRKYTRFKSLMPIVHHTLDGKYHIVRNNWYPKYEADKINAEYCFDFIIEMSIALQQFN